MKRTVMALLKTILDSIVDGAAAAASPNPNT